MSKHQLLQDPLITQLTLRAVDGGWAEGGSGSGSCSMLVSGFVSSVSAMTEAGAGRCVGEAGEGPAVSGSGVKDRVSAIAAVSGT